jgi:hypothetical protein
MSRPNPYRQRKRIKAEKENRPIHTITSHSHRRSALLDLLKSSTVILAAKVGCNKQPEFEPGMPGPDKCETAPKQGDGSRNMPPRVRIF